MSRGYFVWHDLLAPNPGGAFDFYQGVLGWSTEVQDMGTGPYTMAKVGDKHIGGFSTLQAGHPRWVSYISVDNLDESLAQIRALGGTTQDPFTIPGVGTMAFAADPEGAEFAPFQDENADYQPDLPQGVQPAGAVAWHELTAESQDAADDFYGTIFGWKKVVWPMDEGGDYHGLMIGETPVAGVFKRPAEVPMSYWSIYFETPGPVPDAIADVLRLGGSVLKDTFTVEGTGDIAIVKDPDGAIFGLMKSVPMGG